MPTAKTMMKHLVNQIGTPEASHVKRNTQIKMPPRALAKRTNVRLAFLLSIRLNFMKALLHYLGLTKRDTTLYKNPFAG